MNDSFCLGFSNAVFVTRSHSSPFNCNGMMIQNYYDQSFLGYMSFITDSLVVMTGGVNCSGSYYFSGSKENMTLSWLNCTNSGGSSITTNIKYSMFVPSQTFQDFSNTYSISTCVESFSENCPDVLTNWKNVKLISGGGDQGGSPLLNQYYLFVGNETQGKFILETQETHWFLSGDTLASAYVTMKYVWITLSNPSKNYTLTLNLTSTCLAKSSAFERSLFAGYYIKECPQSSLVDPYCAQFTSFANLGILSPGCPTSYASNPTNNQIYGRLAYVDSSQLYVIDKSSNSIMCNGNYTVSTDGSLTLRYYNCSQNNTLIVFKQYLPPVSLEDISGNYTLSSCMVDPSIPKEDSCSSFPSLYSKLVFSAQNTNKTIYSISNSMGGIASKFIVFSYNGSTPLDGWNYPYDSPQITDYASEQRFSYFSANKVIT